MASSIDEITIDYEEEGVLIVKQLDKKILSKGAWTTILFKYQDWDNKKQEYGQPKFSIRRYQKRFDEYKQKSKFNISSIDQAQKIVETLNEWMAENIDQPD